MQSSRIKSEMKTTDFKLLSTLLPKLPYLRWPSQQTTQEFILKCRMSIVRVIPVVFNDLFILLFHVHEYRNLLDQKGEGAWRLGQTKTCKPSSCSLPWGCHVGEHVYAQDCGASFAARVCAKLFLVAHIRWRNTNSSVPHKAAHAPNTCCPECQGDLSKGHCPGSTTGRPRYFSLFDCEFLWLTLDFKVVLGDFFLFVLGVFLFFGFFFSRSVKGIQSCPRTL